jgi:hypothetical protein
LRNGLYQPPTVGSGVLRFEAPEADKLDVVPGNAISLFLRNAFHLQTEDDILERAHPAIHDNLTVALPV